MSLFAKIFAFFLVITLNQCQGCGPEMCNSNIGPGRTGIYQDGSGQHQVTAGQNGVVSHPCGTTVTVTQ